MTNYLRTDEKAMNAEIEKSQRTDQRIKSGVNTAIGLGIGGASLAGAKLGSKILPFLNEHIPYELALKGINKVSPTLGGFLKKGMEKGLNLKDGLDFIKENISGKEEQTAPKAQEHRNIIEQYSPELYQSIKDQVQRGRTPLQAASHAMHDPNFSKIIKKIQNDHKISFATILQNVFRPDEQGLSRQGQQPQQEQMQQQQPQAQQQQSGQGQQALMQMLQKINQRIGQ